jgi:hypothetical protein
MNDFLIDVQEDLERGLFISGFRAMLAGSNDTLIV